MQFYSEEHKQKNVTAHQNDPRWGENPDYFFVFNNKFKSLESIVTLTKPKSILDYGCGKGHALNQLKLKFPDIAMTNYDPFNFKYSTIPTSPSDLVVCYNVLQIIEEKFLDNVLTHINTLSSKNILLRMNIYHSEDIVKWREKLSLFNKIVADGQLIDKEIYPISGIPKLSDAYTVWVKK